MVNNQLALKFTKAGGGFTYVLLQTREGEDALVFPVSHYHAVLWAQAAGCVGLLFVTSTRLIYESKTEPGHSLSVPRKDLKKAEAQNSGRFGKNIGRHILIDTKDGDRRFAVIFENVFIAGYQGDYMKSVLKYFDLAVADFPVATQEFKQTTAKLREEQERQAAERAAKEASDRAAAEERRQAEARARAEEEAQARREAEAATRIFTNEQAQQEQEFEEALKKKAVLIQALTPRKLDALRNALKSLRRIAGATEIGVNFQEYGSRLIDVKADVDEAISGMGNNTLRKEFERALEAFVDANHTWNESLTHELLIVNITLQTKYGIRAGSQRRDLVLSMIWTAARIHIDRLSALLD